MRMYKDFYVRREVSYKRLPGRKSCCIPSQSMSIQEIARRYVKGIPIDVVQREAVYVDQTEFDLEKLGRADLVDRDEVADLLRERQAAIVQGLEDDERVKRAKRTPSPARGAAAAAPSGSSTVPLDNTVLVDTTLTGK